MSRKLFQINEIGNQVAQYSGEEVRQQVMAGSEKLTDSAKPEKVALWVKGAIERLDALVDAPTRNEIMSECGYNCALANQRPIQMAQKRRKKYASLDEFLDDEIRNPPAGTRLEREGEVLYQFYTPHSYTRAMRCYCSLLRGLPSSQVASLTYCQCSRGFVQKYWEAVLERPTKVEILASAVAGAQECKFVIHL